jgi:hypothetical protein
MFLPTECHDVRNNLTLHQERTNVRLREFAGPRMPPELAPSGPNLYVIFGSKADIALVIEVLR